MSDVQPARAAWLKSIFSGRKRIALILALIITSLVATGFVWATNKVSIIADGKKIEVGTLNSSPEEVLAQAGVYLAPKDEYRILESVRGTEIEVFRAVPVTVDYQGKTEFIITGKPTVGEVIESLGISVKNTRTIPGENTRPTPNMHIKAIAVKEVFKQEERPVPCPVIRQPDGSLERGMEQVVEEGQDGVKQVTVMVRYEDGVEMAPEIVAEKVITEPKPEIVRSGTRDAVQTSRGTIRFSRVEVMEATAYNPTDGAPHGLTATGIPARQGIVAVDPDVIKLGTRVYVPGYGFALAADTGGAIVGNRIDLCMEGYNEAWDFGRRMVKVYILDE